MLILGNFIHKFFINSLVVHPKFDTGAAENLWRAACSPRAALWPSLLYRIGPYCVMEFWLASLEEEDSFFLKARLHIRFPHVFTALRWDFYYLHSLNKTKVSNKKSQRNAVNTCGNRMCKLSFNEENRLENEVSSRLLNPIILNPMSHKTKNILWHFTNHFKIFNFQTTDKQKIICDICYFPQISVLLKWS